MFDQLLQIIAPHYCYNCQKSGAVLCESCKFSIVNAATSACVVCQQPSRVGICRNCRTFYEAAYWVGERDKALRATIDGLKFERQYAAAATLAELLDRVIPASIQNAVIVPIPSVASHVRMRGYDHTQLIARALAKRRAFRVTPLLARQTNAVQRGANRAARRRQAERAFACTKQLVEDTPYLLLDDVMTTGATLEFAAKTLYQAGARQIHVAVVARQPMKK